MTYDATQEDLAAEYREFLVWKSKRSLNGDATAAAAHDAWRTKHGVMPAPGVATPPAAPQSAKAEHAETKADENQLVCDPLKPLPISAIPPRPWAYGKFLMFGAAAAIGAVDGVGKGTIATAIALSMITQRRLLGDEIIWRKGPVAIITYEDDETEWRRRIAAACLHYGIDYDTALANFYFISRADRRVSFAANGERNIIFPDGEEIIAQLKKIGAVLLIVDPFNHAHALADGNSNALIANVGYEITRIAQQSKTAVLVLHHLRKGATGDPDDFMGAVALRATFRSVRILARMLADQAEKLKIPRKQAWRYSRISGSKENYAPPPEFATWYKLESQDLGNPQGIYAEGDNVAVATVWTPPSPFNGLAAPAIAEIFDALRKPPGDGLRYSSDPRSDEFAGAIIMEKAGKTLDEAASILGTWINNEVLREDKYVHPKHRHTRTYIALNETKAAEIVSHLFLNPETE